MDFSYFLNIRRGSCPWAQRQEQVFLNKNANTTGLVIKGFDKLYYVVMGGQNVQCLNLFKFFDFLKRVELFLHTLNGHMLASFERDCSEYNWKSTATLLVFQLVLVHRTTLVYKINITLLYVPIFTSKLDKIFKSISNKLII